MINLHMRALDEPACNEYQTVIYLKDLFICFTIDNNLCQNVIRIKGFTNN